MLELKNIYLSLKKIVEVLLTIFPAILQTGNKSFIIDEEGNGK